MKVKPETSTCKGGAAQESRTGELHWQELVLMFDTLRSCLVFYVFSVPCKQQLINLYNPQRHLNILITFFFFFSQLIDLHRHYVRSFQSCTTTYQYWNLDVPDAKLQNSGWGSPDMMSSRKGLCHLLYFWLTFSRLCFGKTLKTLAWKGSLSK